MALLALSSLIAYTLASEPATQGTQGTQASAAGAHDNPRQSDPVQELWRLRSEGNSHFESGVGLKKALAAFEAALALQPSSAIELFNLGTTQRKLGTLDQAVHTLLEAIRADKTLAHPYYTLALIYRSKGDARQAQQYFEQARRLAPAESACYYQLGRLYRENGRAEDALQAFIDALQLNPSHTGALYQLHLYYQEHGAAEEAKRTFEEFSRIKRALTTSRRESNDDESELSHPILGSPPESAPASSDRGHVDLELVKEPLARNVVAFDINDLDGDGLDDLVIVDRSATVRILMNRGGGKFEATQVTSLPTPIHVRSVSLQVLSRGESFRIVVGAREGVLVSDADRAAPQRTFKSVSSADASAGLAFVDLDHDGDVDIVVGRFDTVLINEGNATFQANSYLDTRAREAIRGGTGRLTFADFDGLNAMDAVVYTSAGHPQLLEDALGGKHILAEKNPLPASGRVGWSYAADVDGDGRLDLVTLTDGGMTLYYNGGRRQFKSATVAGRRLGGQTWAAAVADLDNDGRPDVLVLGSQGSFVWRNLGGRRFSLEPVSPSIKPDPSADPVIADLDNDGRRDIVVLQGSGELSWLRNTSSHVGAMVTLELKGLRSAPSGLHAEIEVRRGTFYTKTIADGRPLSVSLGDGHYAEVVRITWADGFVESKFRVEGGKTWSFPESERVSGSCPSVFAWDGRGFHFISDAFISGPMGVPMRPGQYFPPDHDEYLRIPGDSLRADHGRLRIVVTEELREAVYLDQVKLFAVDHPAEVEVYPNEYLMPGELPDFKLHVLSAARPPLAAQDQTGADVLDLIRAADQRYPANFRRLPYDGFAEPQGVEFLLPEKAARAASLRLLLTGWFYYFQSTSLVAAAQRSDLQMMWPQIQVWDHERWVPVMPIGLPSGVDKTVIVDLTGKLPPGADRVRIWTNLALYWDRIAVDTSAPPRDATVLHQAALRNARLRFHGFSAFLTSDTHFPQPERFDYHALRHAVPWNPLEGNYTRYGDVRPVLRQEDSQFVVFGSGDELSLEFEAAALGPVPVGWTRDYLLYLNGYVKDGDPYTAGPGRVEPLPFAGMKHYPYTSDEARVAPWSTDSYKKYQRQYQSRSPLQLTGPELPARSADPPASTGTESR